jgi:hypothetical protein
MPDQTGDENMFADQITDEAAEIAASRPTVTFTLSMVLFACRFADRPLRRFFR